MKQLKRFCVFLLLVGSLHTCLYGQIGHRVKRIAGSTNNQLEVLDWGGQGQAILFLTGLTNTAHVYDGFAPRFTNQFHVYAMSRRGYGASDQTSEGYGIDTLAKDILPVIDALKLDKVILIGHSIAGDEITTFASRYPDRVSKVIYLDAAYDHSNFKQWPILIEPQPTSTDSSSVQNYNSYLKRMRGFRFPDEEIKHQYVLSAQGKLLKYVTPRRIAGKIVRGVRLPDYKSVKRPALAIYGQLNTVEEVFVCYPYMDSINQQIAVKQYMPVWKKHYPEEINRFRNEIPNGTVKEIPGADHYVFLTHPIETEKLIRDFLKNE